MVSDLIKDETITRKFLNTVLKPLKNDEVYVTLIAARKKYCPTMSSMEVVSRDIIRNNDTDKIVRKLKKLSIVEGIYVDKNNNIIPIEAFALYILPEPRSTLKAYNSFIEDINKWNYENLVKSNTSEETNLELYRKLDLKLFSNIHKSTSRSIYFIIDIDRKDQALLNYILNIIKDEELNNKTKFHITESISWISETRGGFHIILNRNEITGKAVHTIKMKNIQYVKFRKETMTPIPGTLQGGFVVKDVDLNVYKN